MPAGTRLSTLFWRNCWAERDGSPLPTLPLSENISSYPSVSFLTWMCKQILPITRTLALKTSAKTQRVDFLFTNLWFLDMLRRRMSRSTSRRGEMTKMRAKTDTKRLNFCLTTVSPCIMVSPKQTLLSCQCRRGALRRAGMTVEWLTQRDRIWCCQAPPPRGWIFRPKKARNSWAKWVLEFPPKWTNLNTQNILHKHS